MVYFSKAWNVCIDNDVLNLYDDPIEICSQATSSNGFQQSQLTFTQMGNVSLEVILKKCDTKVYQISKNVKDNFYILLCQVNTDR